MTPLLTKRFLSFQRKWASVNAFIFIAIFLFSSTTHAMEANGCPDYTEPNISIKQLVVAPRFNDTFDLRAIRALAAQGGANITSTAHETPVGLTAASLKLDTRYEVNFTSAPHDSMVCAQVTQMNLNFGFDDTTVFIAKEIPYGSCSYEVVLAHELQHVKTDRLLVDVTMPVLSGYIRSALKQVGVVRASSPQSAEQHLKNTINDYMAGLGANLSKVRVNQQALIDTETEYDRISKSCDGALGEMIAASRWR